MAAPQICNIQPEFHDSCPSRAKFCEKCGRAKPAKPVKHEGGTKAKAACGHYLQQPEADFCYIDRTAQQSQKDNKNCSCSGGHHGKQLTIQGQHYKLEPGCFLECTGTGHSRHICSGSDDTLPIKGDQNTKNLRRKLQDCIKHFDENSPEIINKLEILRNFLNSKIMSKQCFPKPEWPYCPVVQGPEPYQLPHPYLPNMIMWTKPQTRVTEPQVTLDGRLAELYVPKTFYNEEPPLNVPPWVLPRYKSQELRGGKLISGCKCWMKNGLQDDCPRWDCGGRPECKEKPLPVCPPSMNCPICGIRKPNLYLGKPPTCAKQSPPPPYPEQNLYSLAHQSPPNAPAIPCPLHDNS